MQKRSWWIFKDLHDAASLRNILAFFPDKKHCLLFERLAKKYHFQVKKGSIQKFLNVYKFLFILLLHSDKKRNYLIQKLGCTTLKVFSICMSPEVTQTIFLGVLFLPMCFYFSGVLQVLNNPRTQLFMHIIFFPVTRLVLWKNNVTTGCPNLLLLVTEDRAINMLCG